MAKSDLIYAPEIFGRLKPSWSENDFKSAVKRFNHNAPSVPIPRLYEAYRWLKDQVDFSNTESEKQFSFFIENFLRILETRGASKSEVYSEVLRDSDEYKYLKGLFHSDEIEYHEPEVIQEEEPTPTPQPKVKKITMKNILRDKNIPLSDYDSESWHRLVDEHLMGYNSEESFVNNCSKLATSINGRRSKEQYHIEIIVTYAFERLVSCKKLSLKSKNFAMNMLNMMTDSSEAWGTLHNEYREIIKK